MMTRYEDVETLFLVVFALIFFFLERYFPKNIDLAVRAFLKEDIQAFITLIIGPKLKEMPGQWRMLIGF